MQPIRILKIGGKIMEDIPNRQKVLASFAGWDGAKILVHGGGNRASELSKKLNIEPNVHEGRRVTDAATLEIVTMVYAGLSNKTIVSELQSFGCNALGLSGADLNSIQAKKRTVKNIDYGFVGDIEQINTIMLTQLIALGITPIFCAITHDLQGQLLNTNADTIAAQLAIALSVFFQVQLIYSFEKPGVLSDTNNLSSVIPTITPMLYQQHKSSGTIFAGMIPKLDNAFAAIEQGVHEVVIGGTDPLGVGTVLKKN
jgi:acetylglutamate kinase